ncbi:MAG: hypothetical protein ACMUIS_00980 [bacterium]
MGRHTVCGYCIVIAAAALCIVAAGMVSPVNAYFGGSLFLADPALYAVGANPDSQVGETSLYPGDLYGGLYGGLYGLYGGLYGGGGIYGLGYLGGLMSYLGYLYGVYGTGVENALINPGGLSPGTWLGYGVTYHPLFGYYQPIDLFGSMFALTNLFSWW